MMGRHPTTLTEQQQSEVDTLAAVLTAEQMADYFDIGRTTFFPDAARAGDCGTLQGARPAPSARSRSP